MWRLVLCFALIVGAGNVCAQDMKPMAAAAKPIFEVATIKPSDPGDHSQGFQTRGRHIKAQNESVMSLMMFAYGVHGKQIVGGPDWLRERFDIDGVPDTDGEPNLKQMQGMYQTLLKERFGLRFHREKRELAIYAITPEKGGSKLVASKSPETEMPDQTGNGSARGQTMKFTNNSMEDFALGMQYFLDKPVVNQTGLTGRYDFSLTWNPDVVAHPDSDAPGLFTATREQLGLRMEATKGMVDVLVVDSLQRPTEN